MDTSIKKLRERQNEIVAEARKAADEISGADEGRAAELQQQYDSAMAEFDKIDADIQRRSKLADAEKRFEQSAELVDADRRPMPSQREAADVVENAVATAEEIFTRAMRLGEGALTEAERPILAELRAQSAGTDSEGGFTVPEGFQAEIVKAMKAWGPMLDPGVTRVMNTTTGNRIPWPTVDDTANTGALIGENVGDSEQDVTFAEKQLDAYEYTSRIVRVSLTLLQDSAFNMDGLLAELFGERLGRAINAHLTTGTGTAQPNGIVTAASIGDTAASSSAITFDEIINLLHSVDPAYRSSPSVAFMMGDDLMKAIRQLKDGQGNYLWQAADGRTGEPASILGYRYVINQAMPGFGINNKPLVFGDMSKYVVRRVNDFSLTRLVERYAEFRQVGFFATSRVDGELVDTNAVKVLQLAAA